jgi:hypothetical protein
VIRYVDRETAARYQDGVDYSETGHILVRAPALRSMLVWRRGRKFWSARSQAYAPAGFQIVPTPGSQYRGSRRIGEQGGRLSAARISSALHEIDGHFGEGATEAALRAHGSNTTALIED